MTDSIRDSLPLLFQDEHLVVVDKPSGLLVHRSNLDRHAQRFALQLVRDRIGGHVYPTHRLDRGTSGVLVFGRTPETAKRMAALFAQQQVRKLYLGVVRGYPPIEGLIDHPLSRHYDDFEFRSETAASAPQPAQTRYWRLATVELPHAVDRYPSCRYALLKLQPLSGRRHQIRRHLKHIAHPIIGDATYGKGQHNRLFQSLFNCNRLLLACLELQFQHPVTHVDLTLRAPLAADFGAVIRQLGWLPAGNVTPADLYSEAPAKAL